MGTMSIHKGTGCCCGGFIAVLLSVIALAINECVWNNIGSNTLFSNVSISIAIALSFIGSISTCIPKLINCKTYTYLIYSFSFILLLIVIIIWATSICSHKSIETAIWLLIISCIILFIGIISSYKRFGINTILMNLPQNVKYIMLKKSIENEQIVKANIDNNSLFVVYKLKKDKLSDIKKLIPKHLDLVKHKIYETDEATDNYLLYNIYLSYFESNLLSIRLEINVICYNKATKNHCFVIIDYYTDEMRFDPVNPFGKPNCKSNGYQIIDDYLKCGIKSIHNDTILFEYYGEIIQNESVKPDNSFLYANNEFYFGGTNPELLEENGFTMFGEFDAGEHNNYKQMVTKKIINNLFSDVIEELNTSFIIPNPQYYEIKITATKDEETSNLLNGDR